MEDKIDILLATYNGAEYIENQLYSILMQDYKNWTLLIHDDGSQDGTVDIIKRFAKNDSRICLINDGIIHLGPGNNFMHLLHYSTAPFICFADQDDIWFENKISTLLQLIKLKNNSVPQVIYSNRLLWQNGEVYHSKFPKFYTFKEILFQNGGLQGCCSMFNREMLLFIDKKYDSIAMHDHILTLAAILTKSIDYYDKPLFLYRRHTFNVTQIYRSLKQRLFNRSSVVDKSYYDGVRSFYNIFYENFQFRDRKILELYLQYYHSPFIIRFLSVIIHGYSLSNSKFRLWVKLILCPYHN